LISLKLGSECIAVIAICSLSVGIYEPPHSARRAYNQTLPAVKTGQPLIADAKIVKIRNLQFLIGNYFFVLFIPGFRF